MRRMLASLCLAAACLPATRAAEPPAGMVGPSLMERTGADERGMRRYVLVVLKTGPTPVQDAEARRAMFAGHFANMARWTEAGQLVLAGPFTRDASGWRGLYVFALAGKAEAKALTETDPVIASGEMVAEYHDWYGSAALMLLPGEHAELEREARAAAD